jgi:hypothetical protein
MKTEGTYNQDLKPPFTPWPTINWKPWFWPIIAYSKEITHFWKTLWISRETWHFSFFGCRLLVQVGHRYSICSPSLPERNPYGGRTIPLWLRLVSPCTTPHVQWLEIKERIFTYIVVLVLHLASLTRQRFLIRLPLSFQTSVGGLGSGGIVGLKFP